MCGLIASFNTAPTKKRALEANQFIVEQFEDQHTRGTRGFGFINIAKNMSIEVIRACETAKFIVDLYMNKSSMIIAHHRTPTSTDNKMDQTHPMFISNEILQYDYYVVHNGIITNDTELYKKHEELGFLYRTEYLEIYSDNYQKSKFNDSEAIAIELALFIEGKITNIGTSNTAAFIILQTDKKTKKALRVFFGKNEKGDLNIDKTDNKLNLSSEGTGEEVASNMLFSFDPKDVTMTLTSTPIPFQARKEYATARSDEWKQGRIWNSTKMKYVDPPAEKTEETRKETVEEKTKEKTENKTEEIIPIVEKGHASQICMEFKNQIKDESTTSMSHIIDDTLDDQVETMEEIITEYKNLVLVEKINKDMQEFYENQINIVMTTMRAIGNIAYAEYTEKMLQENDGQLDSELEAKLEMDDYNMSYEQHSKETETNWAKENATPQRQVAGY